MINLSNNQLGTIENAANLIANVVNQAIVRPTGNNPTTGINGFVFDIWGQVEVRMETEITDHYVEDNYAVQDHAAQKPIIVMMKGYVGEIANIIPNTILSLLAPIPSLAPIATFATEFTNQAQQAYATLENVGSSLTNYIAQAENVNSLLTNALTAANKQQSAYSKFKGFWASRALCSVETPYETFGQMLITSVVPSQPEETELVSEFVVTFKQIRTVSTVTIPAIINNPAGSGVTPIPNPSGALQTTINPLLSSAENNTVNSANNALGRVSNSLSPVNQLGQTAGQTTDISALNKVFGFPS